MINLNFEHKEGQGFVLSDFPNAEKIISLNSAKAQELADLALHRSDLREAQEYLNLSIDSEEFSTHENIFWEMAIIKFSKCFGKNNARPNRLEISKILPDDPEGKEVYVFFKDLRNKNIIHDENSISQCLVGAIINKPNSTKKVDKIITMNFLGKMNTKENESNLKILIEKTLLYVENQYDILCEEITQTLEAMPYDELIKFDTLEYSKPDVSEVSKKKKSYLIKIFLVINLL